MIALINSFKGHMYSCRNWIKEASKIKVYIINTVWKSCFLPHKKVISKIKYINNVNIYNLKDMHWNLWSLLHTKNYKAE